MRLLSLPGALAAAAAVALLVPVVATAATPSEVAEALELRGYFVEGDAAATTVNTLERLAAGASTGGGHVHFVALGEDPAAGNDAFAREVQSLLADSERGTIYVQSPGEIGADSVVFDDAQLGAAFDDTEGAARECFELGAATFLRALGGSSDVAVTCPERRGGGGWKWLLALLAIPLGFVGLALWSRRRARRGSADELDQARSELKAQLDVVASEIVESQDAVQVSGSEQAVAHFRDANELYAALAEQVPRARTLVELGQLSDRIDLARWHVDCAQAIVAGRPLPPEPKPDAPAACFFDPTHRPGSEPVTINTPAGSKEVHVCPSCAAALARGERPTPREVDVRGRSLPSAKAPRSHGGLGMGGLSIFEIVLDAILGGLGGDPGSRRSGGSPSGSGIDFDWGDPVGGRRRRSGPFGPDLTPSGGWFPRGGGARGGGIGRRGASSGRPSIGRARRRL